jgi:hypothetical protein
MMESCGRVCLQERVRLMRVKGLPGTENRRQRAPENMREMRGMRGKGRARDGMCALSALVEYTDLVALAAKSFVS